MHINRELPSRRPTTVDMLRDEIADEAHGLSDLQLLKLFRKKKIVFQPRHYPEFKQTSKAIQEYSELTSCIGPYSVNFAKETHRLMQPSKNQEVQYLQCLVQDLADQ